MPDITLPPFSGDYSRSLLREQKKYLGALQLQGKFVVDADLNDAAQISAFQNIRVIQSGFPSSAVAEAFKIVEHPEVSQRADNFYVMARGRDNVLAVSSDPESYARMYVRGIPAFISAAEAVLGGVSFSAGVSPTVLSADLLAELHHRSTALTDTELTDTNARFPTMADDGYDLRGMQLIPNVEDGTVFTIAPDNTATTLTITGTGMLAVAQAGRFYRIAPVAPSGAARRDIIWLDVYVGESDAVEDPLLLHPINAGYEASRRLVVRQQLRYDQDQDELPFGPVYQDTNGAIHYAVALAWVDREDGNSAITSAMITDLRDPHFGSSFEVAEARGTYVSLKARIDAADAGVSVRYSAQPREQSLSLAGVTNVVQLLGQAYVGDLTTDDPAEFVKLYEKTGRFYVHGNPASLISSVTAYSPTVPALTTQDLVIKFNDNPTPVTVNFSSPADLDAIVSQINAAILAASQTGEGEALKVNNRLALRSVKTNHTSRVEVFSTSAALVVLFTGNDLLRYASNPDEGFLPFGLGVTNKREPKVRAISSNDALTDSVIGSTPIPTGFFSNPFFEFDMLLSGEMLARYGVATLFADERSDSYARRGVWDRSTDWDSRVEVEHNSDGTHKAAFLKSSYVDWGAGPNQVNASSVPLVGTFGDMVAVQVNSAIEELEGGKLSRGGSASRRTMLDDLLMGTKRVFRETSGNNLLPLSDRPDELVTKFYVDSLSIGIVVLPAVRAASTAALSATYAGGPVGATLTATSNGAFGGAYVDGVTGWSVGQRVLVKNQPDPIHNGTYSVTTVGDGSNPYVLTRGVDFDDETATSGAFVYVMEGTLLIGTTWVVGDLGNPTIGTDPINWNQFSSVGVLQAGDGLTLSGLTLAVGVVVGNPLKTNPDNTYVDLAQLAGSTGAGATTATGLEAFTASAPHHIRLAAQGFGMSGGAGQLLSVNTTAISDATKGIGLFSSKLGVKLATGGGLAFNGSGEILVSGASNVGYTPSTPADWSSVPSLVSTALDTLASDRVRRAGDTMTGDLTIQKVAPVLTLDKTSGATNPILRFLHGGVLKGSVESTPTTTNLKAVTSALSVTTTGSDLLATFSPDTTIVNGNATLTVQSRGTGLPKVVGTVGGTDKWWIETSATDTRFKQPAQNIAFVLPFSHPVIALKGYSALFHDSVALRTLWNSGITLGTPHRLQWRPWPIDSGDLITVPALSTIVLTSAHGVTGVDGSGYFNIEGIGTRGAVLSGIRIRGAGLVSAGAGLQLILEYTTDTDTVVTVPIANPLTTGTVVDKDLLFADFTFVGGNYMKKLRLKAQNTTGSGTTFRIASVSGVVFLDFFGIKE